MSGHITNKNLFWDLGNTLLKIDAFKFARHIGLVDVMLYPLIDRNHPTVLFDRALEFLATIKVADHGTCQATAQGRPLPPIVCAWLAGNIPLTQVTSYLQKPLSEQVPEGFFKSKREERLVKLLLSALTTPETITSMLSMITEGVDLLKECAEQYDADGNQYHTLFVLSNWDPYSFEDMVTSPQLLSLFNYFDKSNLIISGDIGTIKPHSTIYSYVLDTYKLIPHECILIDDQHENIAGAKKHGMHGILLHNGNYEQVREQLRQFNVIA